MGERSAVLGQWETASTPAGLIDEPSALNDADLQWTAAAVPGTVAGALRDAGSWGPDDAVDFDEFDWWFRTEFDAATANAARLRFGGIATIAEVWLNGRRVLQSDNMFLEHVVEAQLCERNKVVVCCRSLRRHLAARRPRPRWKTRLVEAQQLRWVRTSLLGRMPSWTPPAAPVGIWRTVEVLTDPRADVRVTHMKSRYEGQVGRLDFAATVDGLGIPDSARLVVGDVVAELDVDTSGGRWSCSGTLVAPDAAPWFPSTAGDPVLHPASLQLELEGGTREFPLGNVGYRTITVDDSGDGFALVVNGVPVFCRGACWVPPDVITLNAGRDEVRRTLERVRAAGMNMVRITGTMVYERDDFYDLCDELGILVWQDFMFANMDYPIDDPEFRAGVENEAAQLVARLRRHPSVVVLCGGSEVEQQAAMVGMTTDDFSNPLGRSVLAVAVADGLPGAAYVPCSPSGGVFSFSPASGVAHYYGVGAYMQPLEDARRASVRFASECLAFANVPARESVDAFMRDGDQPNSPRWKARVPRDRGVGWDFDDVRDHYVRRFFGCDPLEVRYADPERYLDLGRAAVHIAIDATISEWRRPGSTCAGALVLHLRDLWDGAGWGLLDHAGRPKSAYDAMARACAPTAVLLTDEGLNGLHAHLVNDRVTQFEGSLSVRVFGVEGALTASAEKAISIPARDGVVQSIDELLGGFRDLTYAYRFGPRVGDLVSVQLRDETGVVSEAHYFPGGHDRPAQPDLGLRATGRVVGDNVEVHVESDHCAQFVCLDIRGHAADVNWFHLAPGDSRTISARPVAENRALLGEVTALNMLGSRSVKFLKEAQP
jgi:beta-mannosidase